MTVAILLSRVRALPSRVSLVAATVLLVGGCMSMTPEERLRWDLSDEIYATAARECANRYHTVRVTHVAVNGDLQGDTAADSKSETRRSPRATGRVSRRASRSGRRRDSLFRSRSICTRTSISIESRSGRSFLPRRKLTPRFRARRRVRIVRACASVRRRWARCGCSAWPSTCSSTSSDWACSSTAISPSIGPRGSPASSSRRWLLSSRRFWPRCGSAMAERRRLRCAPRCGWP